MKAILSEIYILQTRMELLTHLQNILTPTILLTIPHSLCHYKSYSDELKHEPYKYITHECDYTAYHNAIILKSHFKNIKTIIYPSTELRELHDLNRSKERHNKWRQNLLEITKTHNIKCTLDIHSFNDAPQFGLPEVYEIVILDSWYEIINKNINYLDNTSTNLTNYLKSKDIKAILLPGGENDIMLQMRQNKILSLLIEFNEGIKEARLQYICSNIATYFFQLLTTSTNFPAYELTT